MLCRSAVGSRLTSYNTWVTGPREAGNVDGPEEFHLVIVDNGRSEILGSQFKDILRCIRCGARLNTCPAYRNIGGHAYGSIYPGPIGAVISPLLEVIKIFMTYLMPAHYAMHVMWSVRSKPFSTIDPKHRRVMAESGLTPKAERRVTSMFNYINAHPTLWKVGMNVGAKMAGLMIKMAQLQSRLVYSMIGWHHVISKTRWL